jgi:predicted component of type VI protein secretion system
VLKAFTMWLKLNPELTGLSDSALAGHPLVLLSLSGLQHADLFDEAVDATAELIYSSGLMMHHAQPPSRYMPLVQELVHAVRLLLSLDSTRFDLAPIF